MNAFYEAPEDSIAFHYRCFDRILRTEPATKNVNDYGVGKAVENVPAVRARLQSIIDNYLDIQQDICMVRM